MAAPEEQQHGKKFNRKRKKSFLVNARGMGKKGNFGHGSQLDQDTYDYLLRVLELLKGDFDNPQEKESLVMNAFVETEGNEVHISSNQVGSRAIETLIRLAPPSAQGIAALVRFMDVFASNLRVVATNRFASHVLQSLISKITNYGFDKARNGAKPVDTDEVGTVLSTVDAFNWILKVAKFTLNNLDEFVWDEYANYVTRTVLQCLAGSPPADGDSHWCSYQKQQGPNHAVFTSSFSKEDEEKEPEQSLPEGFKDVVKDFYERIFALPQFTDLPYSNTTSPLLQTLLMALSKNHRKLKKNMIKQLIDRVFSVKNENNDDKKDSDQGTGILPVFTTDASIRLLEAALEHAPSKYVTQIYAMCFMGHLIELASDQAANFSVQRLLAKMNDKDEFESLCDELAPGLDKLIASGKSGVVLAFCQACKRLSTKQGFFVEHLMRALDCHDPAERRPFIAPLCVRLCTYENFKAQESEATPDVISKDGVAKSRLNLHGTLIIQTLLSFNKPIKIVNSILEMPGVQLKALMCDTKGCHIMDAFVKSEFVGEKSRDRLLHKLQGSYVAMACSKHGSRALEALYAASSMKNQMKIMEELAGREGLVTGTPSGRLIANKWHLDLFRHRRNEWKQLQSRKERTKELFADIIGPETVSQT